MVPQVTLFWYPQYCNISIRHRTHLVTYLIEWADRRCSNDRQAVNVFWWNRRVQEPKHSQIC